MADTLVNRVAESGLITLKPEDWISKTTPAEFDLKDYLFMGLILKEKEFRARIKDHDWSSYTGRPLCLFCSADAIIPSWAYMLISTHAAPYAAEIFYGTSSQWRSARLMNTIDQLDVSGYQDQMVIIKGCSEEFAIGPEIYVALTAKLVPVVKSLMFGEPCSTVPVFKRPKANL
jgi:hypothetical protein